MYGNKEVDNMGIDTINWLKKQFDLIGVSFDNDILIEIDKTIKFSAMAFQLSYYEIFYAIMQLIQKEGGVVNEKRIESELRRMARRNENKSRK